MVVTFDMAPSLIDMSRALQQGGANVIKFDPLDIATHRFPGTVKNIRITEHEA
jgi:hypothetical protein